MPAGPAGHRDVDIEAHASWEGDARRGRRTPVSPQAAPGGRARAAPPETMRGSWWATAASFSASGSAQCRPPEPASDNPAAWNTDRVAKIRASLAGQPVSLSGTILRDAARRAAPAGRDNTAIPGTVPGTVPRKRSPGTTPTTPSGTGNPPATTTARRPAARPRRRAPRRLRSGSSSCTRTRRRADVRIQPAGREPSVPTLPGSSTCCSPTCRTPTSSWKWISTIRFSAHAHRCQHADRLRAHVAWHRPTWRSSMATPPIRRTTGRKTSSSRLPTATTGVRVLEQPVRNPLPVHRRFSTSTLSRPGSPNDSAIASVPTEPTTAICSSIRTSSSASSKCAVPARDRHSRRGRHRRDDRTACSRTSRSAGPEQIFHVRPESPEQVYRFRSEDPRISSYRFSNLTRLKDGTTRQSLPEISRASRLAVNDPFDDALVIELVPLFDPAAVRTVFVDIEYDDAENNYSRRERVTLEARRSGRRCGSR